METAGTPDVDLAVTVVGAQELVFDAEPAAERERPRLFREKRVGPRFDGEAVDTLGLDRAAEPIARFEHPELERAAALARQLRGPFDQPVRRGETRDAAADDDELHAAARTVRRTTSASAAMKSG